MPAAHRDHLRLSVAVAVSIGVHAALMLVLPLRDSEARPPLETPEPAVVEARAVEVLEEPPAPPEPMRPPDERPVQRPLARLEEPDPIVLPEPPPEPDEAPEPPPEPEPEEQPEPVEQPEPLPEERRAPSVDQFEWNDAFDPLAAYLGERNNRAEEQTIAEITSLDDPAATPELAASDTSENTLVEDGADTDALLEREAIERVVAAAANPRLEDEPVAEPDNVEPGEAEPTPPEPAEAPEPVEPNVPVEPVIPTPQIDVAPAPGGDIAPVPPPRPLDAFGLSGAFERARVVSEPSEGGTLVREAASSDALSYLEVFSERDNVDGDALEEERRRQQLAGDHVARWERTRAALENFDVAARTGTETHLSTMSDPFAAYLHALHNEIHPLWSGYLSFLDFNDGPGGRLSDPELMVELEYVIRGDGTVDDINIVRGSGEGEFDGQAIDILWNIGPHDPPPPTMLSPNGFAYIHWEFHRDEQMCWTGGASVRMLAATE